MPVDVVLVVIPVLDVIVNPPGEAIVVFAGLEKMISPTVWFALSVTIDAAVLPNVTFPFSTEELPPCHCAPSLHMHVGCATPGFRHLEYFHDHARIERMLFDGFIAPSRGEMKPDRSRSGLGLTFKKRDAERYAVKDWK